MKAFLDSNILIIRLYIAFRKITMTVFIKYCHIIFLENKSE